MSYVLLATAKRYLRVTHAADDVLIQSNIDSAEEWLALRCGFLWAETADIESNVDGGGISLWPPSHPVISVSEVLDTEGSTAESTNNYNLCNNSQVVHDGELRWAKGRGRWQVTYTAGYGGAGAAAIAIPDGLTNIVLGLIARAYNNRGGIMSEGAEGFTVIWQKFIDTDIARQIQHYDWTSGVR